MPNDYTPPEDEAGFDPDSMEVAVVEKPEPTGKFEFDPDRSSGDITLLNVQELTKNPQSGLIKHWAYSTLDLFQRCPAQLKFRKINKIPEPSSEQSDRGNRIHDFFEDFVTGIIPTLDGCEAKKFEAFAPRLNLLRTLYKEGGVEVEQNWGLTADFKVLPEVDRTLFKNPYLWWVAKLDVFVRESLTSAVIIDYKSGKKFMNEMKHSQQGMQYAIAAFLRYPDLEFVRVEFWYVDQADELVKSYTRDEAMVLLPRVTERALKLTTAMIFPPKPSARNCKWCHYATTKDCEYAYEAL